MSGPSTTREALIVEALGEVALLLERMEAMSAATELGRLAIMSASADLEGRLKDFELRTVSMAQHLQVRMVEHVVRRTTQATNESIESQSKAMDRAARLAFSKEASASLARLANALHQGLARVNRPWESWLTHAATAATSAAITAWIVSSYAFH